MPQCTDPSRLLDDNRLAKVKDGTCKWFCAQVTASQGGHFLANIFLCSCYYKDEKDFIETAGYVAMREQVVIDAELFITEDDS